MERINPTSSLNTSENERFVERPDMDFATIIPAIWLNAVQEELLAIIEGGSINPSSNTNQAFTAIQSLINKVSITQYINVLVSDSPQADYSSLQAAITAEGGDKVYHIDKSESINSTITIPFGVNDVELIFSPRSRYTKGSANIGFFLHAERTKITGLRLSGFSGSTDTGIFLQDQANNCLIKDCHFSNNRIDFSDTGSNNIVTDNIYTWNSNGILNNRTSFHHFNGLGRFEFETHASRRYVYQVVRRTDTTTLQENGFIDVLYNHESLGFEVRTEIIGDFEAGINFELSSLGLLGYTSSEMLGANYSGSIKMNEVSYLNH